MIGQSSLFPVELYCIFRASLGNLSGFVFKFRWKLPCDQQDSEPFVVKLEKFWGEFETSAVALARPLVVHDFHGLTGGGEGKWHVSWSADEATDLLRRSPIGKFDVLHCV